MSFWKKLQNPFALVGQGFIAGGILFFAMHGVSEAAVTTPTAIETAR